MQHGQEPGGEDDAADEVDGGCFRRLRAELGAALPYPGAGRSERRVGALLVSSHLPGVRAPLLAQVPTVLRIHAPFGQAAMMEAPSASEIRCTKPAHWKSWTGAGTGARSQKVLRHALLLPWRRGSNGTGDNLSLRLCAPAIQLCRVFFPPLRVIAACIHAEAHVPVNVGWRRAATPWEAAAPAEVGVA